MASITKMRKTIKSLTSKQLLLMVALLSTSMSATEKKLLIDSAIEILESKLGKDQLNSMFKELGLPKELLQVNEENNQ